MLFLLFLLLFQLSLFLHRPHLLLLLLLPLLILLRPLSVGVPPSPPLSSSLPPHSVISSLRQRLRRTREKKRRRAHLAIIHLSTTTTVIIIVETETALILDLRDHDRRPRHHRLRLDRILFGPRGQSVLLWLLEEQSPHCHTRATFPVTRIISNTLPPKQCLQPPPNALGLPLLQLNLPTRS